MTDTNYSECDVLSKLRSAWPNPEVLLSAEAEILKLRRRNEDLENLYRGVLSAINALRAATYALDRRTPYDL